MTVSLLCVLSLLVSSAVFWQLRLVGITMSNDACCGKTEHIHTDECVSTQILICGLEESTEELSAAACNIPEHIHSDACYEEHSVLICTVSDEDSEHEHEDTCYETERILECQEQEHIHTEDCLATTETFADSHVHTAECYETVYSCGFAEEHEHSVSCYSDPGADLETAADWEATLPDTLSGEWPSDLIAVAQSQYGYQESDHNFILASDGETRMGYTRYGEWAGNPYGNWNALFASFCLHYAGIPESSVPTASGAVSWRVKLSDAGLYAEATGYSPQEGDLVFFADGTVGILVAIRGTGMYVIAGDVENAVWQGMYDLSDASVLGYGCVNTACRNSLEPDTGSDSELDNAPSMEEQPSDPVLSGAPSFGDPPSESEPPQDEIGENELPTEEDSPEDEILPDEEEFPGGEFYLMTAVSTFAGMEAPDYLGTINSKNAWQLVNYGYNGRTQSDKLSFDGNSDGKPDVYLQKNVVSTATENEFLVYLSMDKKMTWERLLDNSEFYVTSANAYQKYQPGDLASRLVGNSTIIYEESSNETSNRYLFTLQVYETKGDSEPIYTYSEYRYGSAPNCNNGTLLMKAESWGNQYMLIQSRVSLQIASSGSNALTAQIYLDEFDADFAVYQTVFEQVSDVMGENIEFIGVENCDGTTSFNETTETLTWLPIDNTDVLIKPEGGSGSTFSGWDENITQLVYRVRLNTETEDFHSCADNMDSVSGAPESYPINKEAVLSYHTEPIPGASGIQSDTMTAIYPVPEVRGLNYDIAFWVVDEDTEEYLPNAKFALYEGDGTTPVLVDGEPYIITTAADHVTKFRDLPCGTYVMKQIEAPPGYCVGEEATWTIPLCYTDYPEQLKQDAPPIASDINNMRWTLYDSQWLIPNVKNPFTYQIKVIKTSTDGTPLADAQFSLTPTDDTLEGTTDDTGVYLFPGEYSPNMEYTLTELRAPDGYCAICEPIRFTVALDPQTNRYEPTLSNDCGFSDDIYFSWEDSSDPAILRITVKNHTGYRLPETGGVGTTMYTFGGLLLMTAAVVYGYLLRRSQEGRSRE